MGKILVIDDDPDSLELIRVWLERNHYQVCDARDGVEGLAKVDSEQPDLIVLDISMPAMDGYSFLKELKQKYPVQKIPIIVFTGKDKMEELFRWEGVRDYLVKPCALEEFLGKVRQYVKSGPY